MSMSFFDYLERNLSPGTLREVTVVGPKSDGDTHFGGPSGRPRQKTNTPVSFKVGQPAESWSWRVTSQTR